MEVVEENPASHKVFEADSPVAKAIEAPEWRKNKGEIAIIFSKFVYSSFGFCTF